MRGYGTGRVSLLLAACCAAIGSTACDDSRKRGAKPVDGVRQLDRRLDRQTLNARAARADLPIFWIADTNGNDILEPRELAVLWRVEGPGRGWVDNGKLTPKFVQAYDALLEPGPQSGRAGRAELVEKELSQGLPTLVYTDLSASPKRDRALVRKVAEVARAVERVHMRQLGSLAFARRVPQLDAPSRALFNRNQSPWCMAPATEGKADCGAFDDLPPKRSGLYPADLQQRDDFCRLLSARNDGEELLDRFHAVQRRDGELVAVPYSEAFEPEMKHVAERLDELAAIIGDDETALRAYVRAAADAFATNDWAAADQAWVAMQGSASRWYLRVAPDEVYFSPCGRKAMFHLSLGRIDRQSRTWKRKLALVKSKMEQLLAELAGEPYRARSVDLQVPDFVNIILNAGDARRPMGAYIGQSLPNAGPVAQAGLRRTVAFSNLYADPDSRARFERTARAYFCADSAVHFSSAPRPRIISTVLHDASRNLGPTDEYEVGGRRPQEIFGGPLANMLEELKAQSASMHIVQWLQAKELVEPEVSRQTLAFGLIWAFSHVSRGMFTPDGRRLAHGHVGAIEVGSLLDSGALVWRGQERSADGRDEGCFSIDFDAYPRAARGLAAEVVQIKARGDRARAEALQKKYVDEGPKELFEVIRERGRRQPSTTFVYAFRAGEEQ